MQHAAPGDTRPLAETLPIMRGGGVHAVSQSGVLGNPTGATAIEGSRLLDDLAAVLIDEVETWWSSHPAVDRKVTG
jgi:creatinine amidohydrolase